MAEGKVGDVFLLLAEASSGVSSVAMRLQRTGSVKRVET